MNWFLVAGKKALHSTSKHVLRWYLRFNRDKSGYHLVVTFPPNLLEQLRWSRGDKIALVSQVVDGETLYAFIKHAQGLQIMPLGGRSGDQVLRWCKSYKPKTTPPEITVMFGNKNSEKIEFGVNHFPQDGWPSISPDGALIVASVRSRPATKLKVSGGFINV